MTESQIWADALGADAEDEETETLDDPKKRSTLPILHKRTRKAPTPKKQ